MIIKIEIPSDLAGYIMSLEVEELDDDKIIDDVISSSHYDNLISYGLINCTLDDDELPICYLTRLGKLVYEEREAITEIEWSHPTLGSGKLKAPKVIYFERHSQEKPRMRVEFTFTLESGKIIVCYKDMTEDEFNEFKKGE